MIQAAAGETYARGRGRRSVPSASLRLKTQQGGCDELQSSSPRTAWNRDRSDVRIVTDPNHRFARPSGRVPGLGRSWRDQKMKLRAESGSGRDGFSRLDWPASELLRVSERTHSPAPGENSRLSYDAFEVLREARRARAEAMGSLCRSLLNALRRMVSDGLSALAQPRAVAGEASRRPRPPAVADS
jgi:hypothetical protein